MTEALAVLVALRQLDFEGPVITAYLAEHPAGFATAVADLARSLAAKLDRGTVSASDAVRLAFARVTPDNLAEVEAVATTAVVDQGGRSWSLGRYAEMGCTTIGRAATSRGVADRVGPDGLVRIEVSGCAYCQSFEGTYRLDAVPAWPPFHPHCSCVASAV